MNKIYYANNEIINSNGDAIKNDTYVCRNLLTQLLEEMGLNSKISFGYNEYGKPYIKEYQDVHFNFSHSSYFSSCVVSNKEIGLDIEKKRIIPENRLEKLWLRTMNVEQIKSIRSAKDQSYQFLKFWVIKESFAKLKGIGLSIGLKRINIDEQQVWIDADNKAYYSFFEEEGFLFSVATFAKTDIIICRRDINN